MEEKDPLCDIVGESECCLACARKVLIHFPGCTIDEIAAQKDEDEQEAEMLAKNIKAQDDRPALKFSDDDRH